MVINNIFLAPRLSLLFFYFNSAALDSVGKQSKAPNVMILNTEAKKKKKKTRENSVVVSHMSSIILSVFVRSNCIASMAQFRLIDRKTLSSCETAKNIKTQRNALNISSESTFSAAQNLRDGFVIERASAVVVLCVYFLRR